MGLGAFLIVIGWKERNETNSNQNLIMVDFVDFCGSFFSSSSPSRPIEVSNNCLNYYCIYMPHVEIWDAEVVCAFLSWHFREMISCNIEVYD